VTRHVSGSSQVPRRERDEEKVHPEGIEERKATPPLAAFESMNLLEDEGNLRLYIRG